jgi:hypothetical protein
MDAKQTAMLRDLHEKITGGDFGESDVHSLFVHLREDSPTRSVLHEIGDLRPPPSH